MRKVRAKLPYPMYSMDKLKPGMERALTSWSAKYTGPYVVSCKLDGTSGMLVWGRSGARWELSLYGRGDQRGGFEVNQLIKYVVPDALRHAPPGGVGSAESIAVRGEIIVSKQDFAGIESGFANARSLTNGTVNRIVPDPAVARYLKFVAYEVVEPRLSKTAQMRVLAASGLHVVPFVVLRAIGEESLIETYTAFTHTSPFDIDGIVVEDDGKAHLEIRSTTGSLGDCLLISIIILCRSARPDDVVEPKIFFRLQGAASWRISHGPRDRRRVARQQRPIAETARAV
jgi:NAD-dependent DNA ligase